MKVGKIVFLLVALIVSATFFASCAQGAGELSFDEAFVSIEEQNNKFEYSTKEIAAEGSNYSETHSGSVVYRSYGELKKAFDVYSLITGKLIRQVTAGEHSIFGTATADDVLVRIWYSVDGNDVVGLYDHNGKFVAEVGVNDTYNKISDELFSYGNKLFRIIDGSPVLYMLLSDFSDIDAASVKIAGKYAIQVGDGYVSYYNDKSNLVARYNVPSYATDGATLHLLSDGSLIAQYLVVTEDEDYDLSQETVIGTVIKANVVHELFDPETREIKELDLGGVYINSIINGVAGNYSGDYGYDQVFNTENVPNFIDGVYMENGKVDMNKRFYRVIDNNGKLGKSLPTVNGMSAYIYPVFHDRYVAEVAGYTRYLLNSDGEIISALAEENRFYEYGIGDSENTLYDKDLKRIYSKDDLDQVYARYDDIVIYRSSNGSDNEYYVVSSNGVHQLQPSKEYEISEISAKTSSDGKEFYGFCVTEIKGTEYKYTWYDKYGNFVFETSRVWSIFLCEDGVYVFSTYEIDELYESFKTFKYFYAG